MRSGARAIALPDAIQKVESLRQGKVLYFADAADWRVAFHISKLTGTDTQRDALKPRPSLTATVDLLLRSRISLRSLDRAMP